MVVLSRASLHEHFLFFTYRTRHREHSTHPAHLQAPSVDKLRHQESLWREDLQSGGNPRTTTPTGYEPKERATVSRIEACSGDPYQLYDVLDKLEKKITELLSPKKWRNLERLGRLAPDSKISETSYFQAQMHFDDSVESIADEGGELQKMLTSPLYAQKGPAGEREVSAQYTQADRKESLRSHSSEGQKALVKPNALFHLIRET